MTYLKVHMRRNNSDVTQHNASVQSSPPKNVENKKRGRALPVRTLEEKQQANQAKEQRTNRDRKSKKLCPAKLDFLKALLGIFKEQGRGEEPCWTAWLVALTFCLCDATVLERVLFCSFENTAISCKWKYRKIVVNMVWESCPLLTVKRSWLQSGSSEMSNVTRSIWQNQEIPGRNPWTKNWPSFCRWLAMIVAKAT